jgi:hypothetical protein
MSVRSFFNEALIRSISVDDTPQVFKLKQTRNIRLRSNVQKYLDDNHASGPDWSLENIDAAITPVQLLHTSCFDLTLRSECDDTPEIGISARKGRVDKRFWGWGDLSPVARELKEQVDKDPNLWILYFLGKPERHRDFAGFRKELREKLLDEKLRSLLLRKCQKSLFSVLNDSVSITLRLYGKMLTTQMVDLGTKYRVL